MTIQKTRNETALTIALSGRLDTVTAPELEAVLKDALADVSELRVLLSAQKTMNRQGTMKVIHVNEMILEIFEVTGFSDILTIE